MGSEPILYMAKKTDKKWLAAIIPGVIALIVVVFLVVLFVIKFLWAWIIPDLLPGAVSQGLVAAEIDWYTAFKLAIVTALTGAVMKAKKEHHEWKCCIKKN